MNIFKKTYKVRTFGEQKKINGYAVSNSSETTALLNVQPLSPNELQALPEGERTIKRIKAFGSFPFTSANQYTGQQGDQLFYMGHWFECKSSVEWDHTMLAHYRSEFVILPETNKKDREVVP